jgi:4-carboxymuconolactone decarboxylase
MNPKLASKKEIQREPCRSEIGVSPRIAIACLVLLVVSSFDMHVGHTMTKEDNTKRYQRGMSALENLNRDAAPNLRKSLDDIAPEMTRFIIEFAYGDIYSRPGLAPRWRQIATIAALTAMGNAKPQLEFHVAAALNVGMTPREIIEVMYVTTVFAGFPSGLNGISAAKEVFRAKGVSVVLDEPMDTPDANRRKLGLATLDDTSKGAAEKVLKSLADIAPDMGEFIVDFAYGDVFSRKVLSPKEKEIAMIAVCVAAGTMQPQMKVHLHAALNVGCTKEQIVELMYHMVGYAGFPAALNGLSAAREVFDDRRVGSQQD